MQINIINYFKLLGIYILTIPLIDIYMTIFKILKSIKIYFKILISIILFLLTTLLHLYLIEYFIA